MNTNVLKGEPHLLMCLLLPVLLLVSQMVSAGGMRETAASPEYQERPVLESSLFPSDKNVLGEEAIQKILTSKFTMPNTIKIALFRLQDTQQQQAIRYYGYGYWRSEEYLKIQQTYIDTLSGEISRSDRVIEVASIPSVLTPKDPSLPIIRETAVRLQADTLMVLKLTTDVYEKSRLFQSSQAKAFCTCEGFLLDVRTGLIPFSKIITRDYLATEDKTDANFTETMVRAQKEAALLALTVLGQETVTFISSMPKSAGSSKLSEEMEIRSIAEPAVYTNDNGATQIVAATP
jgi:hypothetical protein